MGSNELKLDPDKMEWHWPWGSLVYGDLLILALDRVALPQIIHNLGVLLNSQLLLKEQLAVMARNNCRSNYRLYINYAFSYTNKLSHSYPHSCLDCCNALYMALLLNNMWKFQLVQNIVACMVLCEFRFVYMSLLL